MVYHMSIGVKMMKIQFKNHRCARCGIKRATLGKYCDDCWRIIYG